MAVFGEAYFWMILIGIILVIAGILLVSFYGESNSWFWILFSIGTTIFSIGVYWYLIQESRIKRERFEKAALQEAVANAAAIGEARAQGYSTPNTIQYYSPSDPSTPITDFFIS